MNQAYSLEHSDVVIHIKAIFRWQKKGRHGVYCWISRNNNRIYLCAVRAWIRIIARFLSLMGESESDCPLAVYLYRKAKLPHYLTSSMVTAEMRSLAVQVHHLTKKKGIDRFSSHSLRVRACCIYFNASHNPTFVQRIHCWDGKSWKLYIRDLVCTAVRVISAINAVASIPSM